MIVENAAVEAYLARLLHDGTHAQGRIQKSRSQEFFRQTAEGIVVSVRSTGYNTDEDEVVQLLIMNQLVKSLI